MTQPDLNACNEPGPIKDVNIDPVPPFCDPKGPAECCDDEEGVNSSQKAVSGRFFDWLDAPTQKKTGIGHEANCDPMQAGHIINDQHGMGVDPDRTTLYRYSKSLRGCDEAMMDLFRDLVILDEFGKANPIPIIWATQEKAVAVLLQENYRKDNSLAVDRIKLPILAIHNSGLQFQQSRYCYHKAIDYLRDWRRNNAPGFTTKERYERDTVFGVAKGLPVDVEYTLYAWTMHREDINQIVEQVILKFSPLAYIRVRGVSWEIGVKLNSVANNINVDPGDKKVNVYKYQFTFTAETYIPQPIVRKKAVLKTRVEIVDSVADDNVSEVIARLEQAVKELQ
jgi:hypothetical protein